MLRLTSRLLLSAILIFSPMAADKCGNKTPAQQKQEFLAYAKDVHGGFVSFAPFIALHKPGLKPKWDFGTGIAGKLITAVEASNKTAVAGVVADLIPIVNAAFAEFINNPNALLILAAVNIALRFFVNHYRPEEVAAGFAGHSVLEEFKAQRVWGCDYVTAQSPKRQRQLCREQP